MIQTRSRLVSNSAFRRTTTSRQVGKLCGRGGLIGHPFVQSRLMDSNTLPVITTPRLVLRWIYEDDIDGLYEVFSDPQVMRYWSSGPLAHREAAAELQREIAAGN